VQCDIYNAVIVPVINLPEANELQKLTAYADKQRLHEKNNVLSVEIYLSIV
jgi:hypothetical protein